ncbi:MAG: hypothetical protein JWM57_363 [Phycisphaerales bacterium]|nr:hypothetical protein [Phycisphaerales bacterium]
MQFRTQQREVVTRNPRVVDAARQALTPVAIDSLEKRVLFAATDFYAIKVIDAATGRGVPQVDLVMTDGKRYTTDSGGTIAFNRSGYMNVADTFVPETYGYKLASGTSVTLTPVLGTSGTVSLVRTQIAERLYRETGVNKYSQTVAVGGTSPITYAGVGAPGRVFGQDSGLTAVYKGKLYEFWGDTGRDNNNDGADDGGVAGKYRTTGGIIDLPANGGLDPAVGENINYILNTDGTLKEMFPSSNGFTGPLVWASSPMVTYDTSGNEKMVIGYSSINGGSTVVDHGFAVWNDSTQQFTKINTYALNTPLNPGQNATLTSINGVSYYIIPNGNAFIRVKNTYADLTNINSYEVYTPLKPGTILAKDTFLGLTHVYAASDINRDANGNVLWTWAANTTALNSADYSNLNNDGTIPWAKNGFAFQNADGTDHPLFSTAGLSYNDYTKSWTFIGQQTFGTSGFGEIWFAQSKNLLGPWNFTRKVQTNTEDNGVNDTYTFYNLIQHPYYSRDGQYLYYEGTNTSFLVDGGFRGEYFKNTDFTGYAYKDSADTISETYSNKSPNSTFIPNVDNFSARFTGTLTYPTTGTYQFRITTDAGAKLTLGTTVAINQLAGTTQTIYTSGNITASANATTSIEVLYTSLTSTAAGVKLEWLTPGSTVWAIVPGSAIKHGLTQPQDNYNTFMYRLNLTDSKVSTLDVGTGLFGQVFDNADLTGYVGNLTNQVLNATWASGTSPLAGVAPTSYSTRYLGMIRPTYSETYTFYTTSDEGVRVWINGQLLTNNWSAHSATTDTATIALLAGKKYDIRVEYYNATGAGQLKLEWSSASQARQVVPAAALYPSSTGFQTTYYDNADLTNAKVVTNASLINLMQPNSSTSATTGTPDPASIVNDGTWSARWTGQIRPDFTGTYTFSTLSDDGIRVWVNGVRIIDNWTNHGNTTNTGTIDLQAGQYYDIVVEYYNQVFASTAKLFWSNVNQTGGVAQLVPQENMLAGPTALGGTNAIDLVAPTLATAVSRRSGAGGADLPLALNTSPATLENRYGGANTLVLTFSEPVIVSDGVLDANDFAVSGAQFVSAVLSGVTMTVQLANVLDVATMTLSLLHLADATGNTLNATTIAARNLAADANRDGTVDFNDFLALQNSYGQSGAGLDADFDASGAVDFNDFLQLQNSFGQSLPPAAVPAAPVTPANAVVTPPTPPAPKKTANLGGIAFNDSNKNGKYDKSDSIAAGKTIWLDLDDDGVKDANEPSTVTDAQGRYTFKNLAAGKYHVRRLLPAGFVESTAARYITLANGQAAANVYVGSRLK